MTNLIKEKYEQYKEIINYLIFGGLTTIVNFIVYVLFAKMFNVNDVISNAVAWFLSVLFAYITNKIYVFKSDAKGFKLIIEEIITFIGCRLLSGIFDIAMFWILVTINLNDILAKILISIIVVILNYIFSKLIIFKNKSNISG